MEFVGFSSFTELHDNRCRDIPEENGVYTVVVPQGFNIIFTANSTAILEYRSRNLLYREDLLEKKYSNVINKNVLYYGKANRRGGLKDRIREFVKYGYKEATNHRGGRAIWQIENNKKLIIGYCPCDDPDTKERQLLLEYINANNQILPLANWRI